MNNLKGNYQIIRFSLIKTKGLPLEPPKKTRNINGT